jgi:hypothetical protein
MNALAAMRRERHVNPPAFAQDMGIGNRPHNAIGFFRSTTTKIRKLRVASEATCPSGAESGSMRPFRRGKQNWIASSQVRLARATDGPPPARSKPSPRN